MTGKLKTKGNMMLATKLEGILKVRRASLLARSYADKTRFPARPN